MANVNAAYGPVLISIVLYAFLYGLATIQTLLFFKFNDRLHPANKVAVAVLWVMSGLDLAFISHFVYYYVIVAESYSANEKIAWSFTGYTAVDFSLLAFAQILYTVRLWQLLEVTDNKKMRAVVCSVLAALIGASICLAIYLPIRMAAAGSSGEYAESKSSTFVLFALANGSLIDWILSCTLSFGLIKAAGTNFGWTDSSFVVFLAYILNTGAFAALFSIGAVISYALDDFSLTFLTFRIIHVALYFNSFLAMMNARFYFQQQSSSPPPMFNNVVSYETSNGDLYTQRHISGGGSSFSSEIPGGTINEVGLPLFESGRMRSKEDWSDEVKMVEIRVDKQQRQAYSRASRPLHRVGRPS